MRAHSTLHNCVVYLGVENHGRFTPLGTGFFVGVAIKDVHYVYIATAAHVIDQIAGEQISVRLNRKSGEAECLRVLKSAVSRNEPNDLAVFPLAASTSIYDFKMIPTARSNQESLRKEVWDWSAGDEVFALGLYTSHYGETRNTPVLRVGNIAAMLDEPVRGPGGNYLTAYLIELKTIAGLSGSPVFVNPPRVAFRNGGLMHWKGDDPAVIPLGILLGYHVVESREDQISVPQFGMAQAGANWSESIDQRNTGFGVVVPYERVIELFEDPKVVEMLTNHLEASKALGEFRPAGVETD